MGRLALRLGFKSCLDEVLIKGESRADSKLLHNKERDAIRQGITLIFVLLKILPTILKQCIVYMYKLKGAAAEKPLTYLDGLRMMTSTIEEGDNFVKDIGSSDQSR